MTAIYIILDGTLWYFLCVDHFWFGIFFLLPKWQVITSNDKSVNNNVTLVQPCCTQKRAQFGCCRCRPRSASSLSLLFTCFVSLILLSPISTWLNFSSETSSHFPILHHLTVWIVFRKAVSENAKLNKFAFRRKSTIKLFWGGTLSHNARCFQQEFLRFVSKCCAQHPRLCGCTIPHNLRRLTGFSGASGSYGNAFGKRESFVLVQSLSHWLLRKFSLVSRLQNQHVASVSHPLQIFFLL